MTAVVPTGCTLELASETAAGRYRFGSDGFVSATIGMKDGPVCAPVWAYRAVGGSRITFKISP